MSDNQLFMAVLLLEGVYFSIYIIIKYNSTNPDFILDNSIFLPTLISR